MSMTSASEARQVAAYWDRIAPAFDAIYSGRKTPIGRALDHWLRRDMYERFDWVMRRAGDATTVCDVGCGSGRFVSALAQRGKRVTGLDFAPSMLRLALDVVTRDGVADRCDFVLSDVLDWQTNRTFDLVIAIGFWDYVSDPLPRLEVIRSITQNHGRFLSAWPRAGTLRAGIRKLRLKAAGCPVYFWTREQVDDYLTEAGFRVVGCEVHGQLYCVEAAAR